MAAKGSKASSASAGGSGHHHRHHHDRHHHHHHLHDDDESPPDSVAIALTGNPDDEEIAVDSEWADFDRLLTEYRLRRRLNTAPSPLVSRRDLHELMGDARGGRAKVSQAFYPCPPTAAVDPDDMDYVQTAVRIRSERSRG